MVFSNAHELCTLNTTAVAKQVAITTFFKLLMQILTWLGETFLLELIMH